MFTKDKKDIIEPEVEADGQYCYCVKCGFHRLLPIQMTHCPKCKIELDWDWFEAMKVLK